MPVPIDFEEIESHYRASPFIAEVCVLPPSEAESGRNTLHALVVPDLGELRARRIVNIRELIRFELEGLSVSRPPHERVLTFDVVLAPLPKTTTGALDRAAIVRQRASRELSSPPPETAADAHEARVVALVQQFVGTAAAVGPAANLEFDLGLDSIERVELLAFLERRFDARVPDAAAPTLFTVRDLAEVFRGRQERPHEDRPSWDALLDVAPDAELRRLLKPRFATAFAVFWFVRIVIRALMRPRVDGVEHLPDRGAYIISPNHQSYVDPLVVESVLPFRVFRRLFFVGAAEYFENALTARLGRLLNIVPVDPDANLLGALRAGAFGLRHGKVLMLFPEGERSIDGRVKNFRKGAAILSQHLGVPIVPVSITGVFEIWPRSRRIDWRRVLPWSGHRVTVRFGAPVEPPPPTTPFRDHTVALRAAVEELWEQSASCSSRPQSA